MESAMSALPLQFIRLGQQTCTGISQLWLIWSVSVSSTPVHLPFVPYKNTCTFIFILLRQVKYELGDVTRSLFCVVCMVLIGKHHIPGAFLNSNNGLWDRLVVCVTRATPFACVLADARREPLRCGCTPATEQCLVIGTGYHQSNLIEQYKSSPV